MGETFCSYISAFNQSFRDVTSVVVKAELQTKGRRLTLLDLSQAVLPCLAAAESRDFVLQQELRELGTHILVCSAQYTDAYGEQRAFRQFFKFEVLPPFVIASRLRAAQGALWLECAVRNAMPNAAFVETVRFRESPAFERIDLESASPTARPTGYYLPAAATRQYLYKLTPKAAGAGLARATGLGQLELSWRGPMGEPGNLSHPVEYDPAAPPAAGGPSPSSVGEAPAPVIGGAAVGEPSVVDAATQLVALQLAAEQPGAAVAGAPFVLLCRLANRSAQARDLELHWAGLPPSKAGKPGASGGEEQGPAEDRAAKAVEAAKEVAGQSWAPVVGAGRQDAERRILAQLQLRQLDGGWAAPAGVGEGPALSWAGPSPLAVGTIPAHSETIVHLNLFALRPGLHQLRGLAVVDRLSGDRFELADLPPLRVASAPPAA
jgi:hypothetical protein